MYIVKDFDNTLEMKSNFHVLSRFFFFFFLWAMCDVDLFHFFFFFFFFYDQCVMHIDTNLFDSFSIFDHLFHIFHRNISEYQFCTN